MKLEWEQVNWTTLNAKGTDCREYKIFAVNPLSETNNDIILQKYAIASLQREQRFPNNNVAAAKARAQVWENDER